MSQAKQSETAKPDLLIVDDDPLITDTLNFVLSRDFTVYVAAQNEVERIRDQRIVVDDQQIGLGGLTLLRLQRQSVGPLPGVELRDYQRTTLRPLAIV